ncbi:MAG: hypothetical protein GY940_01775, partial [bacterium]|nr:hypothetical protein [bacterium]
DVSLQSRFNRKGNQESREVRDIDERLFHDNGGSWYQPVEIKTIHPLLSLRILRFRKLMERECRPWGLKDPRLLFCIDAWRGPADLLVGTFRHPAAVAQSLHRRNSEKKNGPVPFTSPEKKNRPVPFTGPEWEELWYRYNRRLLDLYHETPFPIVNFDWDADRYSRMVANIAHHIGLTGKSEDFFDPKLINSKEFHHREIDNRFHQSI